MAENGNLLQFGDRCLAERLERGELIHLTECPFPLPEGDALACLFRQRQSKFHKNISFDPATLRLAGHAQTTPDDEARLRQILSDFGDRAASWLAKVLPRYAARWQRDRITLRPEEEAIRPLRLTARNDLLHVDVFRTRPTCGARILRLYVNVNPVEPRVWVTSETFPVLLQRYLRDCTRTPAVSPARRIREGIARWIHPGRPLPGSPYDEFMLRLHNYLKNNDDFQERCPKRFWRFAPRALWMAFTDGLSHAVLRGRFALEHSFFVPRSCLAVPDAAPAAILEREGVIPPLRRAA